MYQCNVASDVPGWVDPLQHKYYQKISNQFKTVVEPKENQAEVASS